jgi:hypothetical protein
VELWKTAELSEVAAQFLWLEPVLASNPSDIPVGGAIAVLALSPKKPRTSAPLTSVATEGARIDWVFALVRPE